MTTYSHIDTPFNLRHTCWFCGEPSNEVVEFPKTAQAIAKIDYSPIALPACKECAGVRYAKDLTSIWAVRDQIKHALIDKYAKHLGIGENWTEQELIVQVRHLAGLGAVLGRCIKSPNSESTIKVGLCPLMTL